MSRTSSYLDHDIPSLMQLLGSRRNGHVHIELCPYVSPAGLGVGTLWVNVLEQDHVEGDSPIEGRSFPIATWHPELLGALIHASLAIVLLEDDQDTTTRRN